MAIPSSVRAAKPGQASDRSAPQLRPLKIFHQGDKRQRDFVTVTIASKGLIAPKAEIFRPLHCSQSLAGRPPFLTKMSSVTFPVRRDSDFDGARCPGLRIDLKLTPNLF
jgi:hypothetical protein